MQSLYRINFGKFLIPTTYKSLKTKSPYGSNLSYR